MKSTYNITITFQDSFDRSAVYENATVDDMAQLLHNVAQLKKSEWDVDITKGIDCPYAVNINISTRNKKYMLWSQYTIRIEDGEASI